MASGSDLAAYSGLNDNDKSLQPFAPDISNFTGMNSSKPVNYERIMDNRTQQGQHHHQQSYSAFSFPSNSAGVASTQGKADSNGLHQHPLYMPHRDDPGFTAHSRGQTGPEPQRISTSDQPPGLMTDPFRQDPSSTGKISSTPLPPCPQIEDVTSWSSVSFFISLHLRYQHAIMSSLSM
jgi:hypothetical protein